MRLSKIRKIQGVNLSRGLGALHARPVWPNLEATGAGYRVLGERAPRRLTTLNI